MNKFVISPPSSVITEIVVAGPCPSGLNTCNDTRYWVYVCRLRIVWFCNETKHARFIEWKTGDVILYIIPIVKEIWTISYVTYVNGWITDVHFFFFHVRFVSRFIADSITKELAVDGVRTGRLPRQINRRGGRVMGAGNYRFASRHWNREKGKKKTMKHRCINTF